MEIGKSSSGCSEGITLTIPLKLPGLNEYVRACRANRYKGAGMKARVEGEIGLFVRALPEFDYPVRITFLWQEANKRRDFDNIAFAKKFILDALVREGKLKDDNRRYVAGFEDQFQYGDDWRVILTIERSENANSK